MSRPRVVWDKDANAENAALFPAVQRGHSKAFARHELRLALELTGLAVVETRAIGSLTHLMGQSVDACEDRCEEYDLAFPDGPGSFRRAGHLGAARR